MGLMSGSAEQEVLSFGVRPGGGSDRRRRGPRYSRGRFVVILLACALVACRQASEADVLSDASGDSTGDLVGDGSGVDADADSVPPRAPLFGECVPGSRLRCSPPSPFQRVDACDHTGHWVPIMACDLSHIVPSWQFGCQQACNSHPWVFCGIAIGDPEFEACLSPNAGDIGGYIVTACSGAHDRLLIRGSFHAECPYGDSPGGWTHACRSPEEDPQGTLPSAVDVEYEIACPCEEGVFTIPEIEAMPPAERPRRYPIRYAACTDTGIGRPDLWADEETRASLARLAAHDRLRRHL